MSDEHRIRMTPFGPIDLDRDEKEFVIKEEYSREKMKEAVAEMHESPPVIISATCTDEKIDQLRVDFNYLEDVLHVMDSKVKALNSELVQERLRISVLKRAVKQLSYLMLGMTGVTLITLIHSMGLI